MLKICKVLPIMFVVFFVSCQQEAKKPFTIDFRERCDVKMSELVSDYIVIPLETREDNLIMDASMVRIWNERIYVLDCYSSQPGLYAFRMDGSYIGKIGSFGNGPGEYVMPFFMAVDEVDNKVTVMDVARNRLLCYDTESYKCVEERDMSFRTDCLEYLGDGSLVCYVGRGLDNTSAYQHHIQVLDKDYSVTSSHIPLREFPKRGKYNVMTYFHKYESEPYFHHPFSNAVYRYDCEGDSIELAYMLSCDNLKFPTEEYVIANNEHIIAQLKEDGYVEYYDLLENYRNVLCYFGAGTERYVGAYDKTSEQGFYTNVNRIEDDMGLLKFGRPKTVYDDRFVSMVYMENVETLPEKSVLSAYLKGHEDGNPMVLLYKLK